MNGNAYRNCTCADCRAAFTICSISQPCLKFIEILSGNKCGGMVSDPVKKFANFAKIRQLKSDLKFRSMRAK